MTEPDALHAMPVDPFLHRVEAEERQGLRAGQQRRLPRQFRQKLPARLLLLGDIFDELSVEGLFLHVTAMWSVLGAIDEDDRLTPLGWWGLPEAMQRAWSE